MRHCKGKHCCIKDTKRSFRFCRGGSDIEIVTFVYNVRDNRVLKTSIIAAVLASFASMAVAQSTDKILARWSDGWYVGKVVQKVGNRFKIVFDDGDQAMVPQSGIRRLNWSAGTRVQCNWKGAGAYYWGVIAQKSGSRVSIKYDDGDKEVTLIGSCRVPL